MYGLLSFDGEKFVAKYRGKTYQIVQEKLIDRFSGKTFTVGPQETPCGMIHFTKEGEVTNIGPLTPLAVASMQRFCSDGVPVRMFWIRSRCTVNENTLNTACEIKGGKYHAR
jgi:hypothetical protein